jgi:hypothetical protein
MTATPQQRAYVRVNVARLAAKMWLCQPRVAVLMPCSILNLSGDGAYVEVDTRGMAPGGEVQFVFELPGVKRVSVSGRIVRLEPAIAEAGRHGLGQARCALRFVFYRETERDRLVRWVFDSLASARRHSLEAPVLELASDSAAQDTGEHPLKL